MAKKPFYTPEQLEYFRKQGMKGGKLGGDARRDKLSPERRSEIAKKAVQAREAKRKKKKPAAAKRAIEPKMEGKDGNG